MMTNLSSDLLFGATEVAEFVGVDVRKVYHWMDRRKAGKPAPPVFDVGGQVCARRSELSSWFSGFRDLSTPGARIKGNAGPEFADEAVILENSHNHSRISEESNGSKSEQLGGAREYAPL